MKEVFISSSEIAQLREKNELDHSNEQVCIHEFLFSPLEDGHQRALNELFNFYCQNHFFLSKFGIDSDQIFETYHLFFPPMSKEGAPHRNSHQQGYFERSN